MKGQHLPQLDALRGLAACGVAFFSHFNILSGKSGGPLAGVPGLSWLYVYGHTLVDLFFVLSGFVICHVYLSRDEGLQLPGWRRFFGARIARIYPLHLATLCLTAALFAIPVVWEMKSNLPYDVWHFVLNLLLLQRSGLESYHSFNLSAWSLTAEFIAYILFFLAIRIRARRSSVFAAFILMAVAAYGAGILNIYVTRGIVGFFSGCLLWWYWPHVRKIQPATLVVVLLVGWILAFQFMQRGFSVYMIAGLLIWPALVALAFEPRAGRILSQRWLLWLGDLSFGIYLLHFPVYLLRAVILGPDPLPPSTWLAANLVSIAIVLAAAHVTYRWFELPSRTAVRRWFDSPRPQTENAGGRRSAGVSGIQGGQ